MSSEERIYDFGAATENSALCTLDEQILYSKNIFIGCRSCEGVLKEDMFS